MGRCPSAVFRARVCSACFDVCVFLCRCCRSQAAGGYTHRYFILEDNELKYWKIVPKGVSQQSGRIFCGVSIDYVCHISALSHRKYESKQRSFYHRSSHFGSTQRKHDFNSQHHAQKGKDSFWEQYHRDQVRVRHIDSVCVQYCRGYRMV